MMDIRYYLALRFAGNWQVGLYPSNSKLDSRYYPSNAGLKPVIYRSLLIKVGDQRSLTMYETFDGKKFVIHNRRKFNRKVWKQDRNNDFTKGELTIQHLPIIDDLFKLEDEFCKILT
jgi:hypothetical protein